jgi:hypothetical protein
MHTRHRAALQRVSLFLVLVPVFLGACTTEKLVFRQPFNPPPDAPSGFLGYFDVSTKLTTCGNCHVGQQRDWRQTAHAAAWEDLQNSSFLTPTCAGAGCHTVNWRGNQDSAKVGYEAVQDTVYYGVQCESCHGAGYAHVQDPSVKANRPIPSINVTDDPALEDRSCSGCHRGGAGPDRHQNYLKEWKSSRHGQLRAAQAGNESCQPCHEAKGALRAWGITTTYKELGTNTLMPQNCVVCHDPHGTASDAAGNPLPGQLRFSIATPVLEENLCTRCHGRVDRVDPTPNNARGPHGSQGPVLLGQAGYFPPGSAYDTLQILSSHGSTANPRLCAGCHVNKVSGVDASGNTITFSGHSFHPLPCLQQKSPEIVDTTYRNDCAFDGPSRSWGACTASGCHGDEATAVSRLSTVRAEMTGYIRTIWINSTKCVPVPPSTECVESVDPFPADSGYLARIAADSAIELSFAAGTAVTPAKGALFNVQMLADDLASHPDGSHGVHNPFLYRALLQASIADLLAHYPSILSAPAVGVTAKIQDAIRSGQLRVAPRTEQAIMRISLH